MHININNCQIELIRGDITDQEVDAIVNAANASLADGGGVDGAIHRRGGSAIMRETDEKYPHGCPTGNTVSSGAGNLKAKFVFHAVGPRWKGGAANEIVIPLRFRRSAPGFTVFRFNRPLRWRSKR